MIYHIQNDSELPDNPQKMMDVYNFSLVGEASDPVWEFGNFRQTLFYQQNEKFYGVKIAVPFSKLIGKSFNVLVHVFTHIYANKGLICPFSSLHYSEYLAEGTSHKKEEEEGDDERRPLCSLLKL